MLFPQFSSGVLHHHGTLIFQDHTVTLLLLEFKSVHVYTSVICHFSVQLMWLRLPLVWEHSQQKITMSFDVMSLIMFCRKWHHVTFVMWHLLSESEAYDHKFGRSNILLMFRKNNLVFKVIPPNRGLVQNCTMMMWKHTLSPLYVQSQESSITSNTCIASAITEKHLMKRT